MRKNLVNLTSIVILFCTIFAISCSKTTEVGLDVLDQDQVGVAVIDTLKLESLSIRNDSVISPSYKVFTMTYPSGNFTDPVFGKTTAGIYLQMFPGSYYSTTKLNGAIVDSVVLSLKYDSLSFGNISSPRSLEVYRLTEDIATQDYYSNVKFSTETNPLATKTFIPKVKPSTDKVTILSYLTDTTKVSLDPHLRIRLPNSFGQELLSLDSLTLNTNAEFAKRFKGFYLKPTSDDLGLINFLLTQYTGSSTSYNLLTNVNVYYRDSDGKKSSIGLYSSTNAVKTVNFVANPSKLIKDAINNKVIGDSVVYLQGMNGADIQVSIPKIKNLKGKNFIVNKATLEMFLKPTADGFVTPPQLIIRKKNIGTAVTDFIPDVIFANNASSNLAAFGGKPEKVTINGENVLKYTFNLSNYAQYMIDDAGVNETFYVTFQDKSSNINRAVFYGAKHSKYPMKFKLYYTKI